MKTLLNEVTNIMSELSFQKMRIVTVLANVHGYDPVYGHVNDSLDNLTNSMDGLHSALVQIKKDAEAYGIYAEAREQGVPL